MTEYRDQRATDAGDRPPADETGPISWRRSLAHQGVDPGELTADERLMYESSLRAHETYPGVAWSPSND